MYFFCFSFLNQRRAAEGTDGRTSKSFFFLAGFGYGVFIIEDMTGWHSGFVSFLLFSFSGHACGELTLARADNLIDGRKKVALFLDTAFSYRGHELGFRYVFIV